MCIVEALETRRLILGDSHPQTLNSLNNLANHYYAVEQPTLAEPLYRQVHNTHKPYPHTP